MSNTRIVGIDWGSSSFRAWLIAGDGTVTDELTNSRGVLFASPDDQRTWLEDTLAPWLSEEAVTDIFGVGMIGSRTGISEAPYVAIPATADSWGSLRHRAGDIGGVPLWIYPGLCAVTSSGHDVLRGEEFLVFSMLARIAERDTSVVVCPGTHSKWIVHDSASITNFRTYVTGELFSLWSRHSSIAAYLTDSQTQSGIELGLRLADSTDDTLEGLFPLRAGILVEGVAEQDLSGALSGLLVGREVRTALEWSGLPRRVTLIADGTLLDVYTRALARRGVQVDVEAINPGEAFHSLAVRGSAQKAVDA